MISLALRRVAVGLVAVGFVVAAPRGMCAQSIPVSLGGQTSSLVGVEFDLPIEIDMSARGELLGSYALSVRWDPAVLQVTGGQAGAFGEPTVNDDSLDSGALLITGVNPGGLGGRMLVAVIRLRPLVADTTTLTVSVQELYAAQTFADLTPFASPSDRQFCPALGRFGDLDQDGAANSRDALIALSASIGLDLPGFQVAMGDVDANGSTEARDALIILSHTVGLDVSQFRVFSIAPGTCVVPTATSLVIDPGDVTLTVGQEVVFTAIGVDGSGNATAVTDVFWHSDNPSVAAVLPSGVVGGVGEGTATITVTRGGGDSASATITVLSGRRVYWVDALALNAVNQIGSAALPFGSIQSAVDAAAEGDTIRVRPGRYEESVGVERGVVIEGDTAGGVLRPLLSNPSGTAFTVVGGQRFELHNFRSDSLYQALHIAFAESVLVRNVDFRHCACSYAATIQVDTVTALEIERSQLTGVSGGSYTNGIEVTIGAGLVRVDSSRIAEYAGDGLELIGVDSVDIRSSTFEHLRNYGVYACGVCSGLRTTALVVSGTRMRGPYTKVYVDGYRSARFDHNVFERLSEDHWDDDVYLDNYDVGPGVGVVTFLGDSLLGGYDWLRLRNYDSLVVDSVFALGNSSYLDGGRHTEIRNSRFQTLRSDYGLQIDPYPLDSATVTGVLHNLEILGPDLGECDRCYEGLEVGWGHWDIDGITLTNWSTGIDVWDATATIRNVTVDHAYYAIERDCGSTHVVGLQASDVQYGVYFYACEPTDALTVDSSYISATYTGIDAGGGEGTLIARWNTVTGSSSYGIRAYDTNLFTEANHVDVLGSNYGIYFQGSYYYGSDSLYTASIVGDTVVCANGYNNDGIYLVNGDVSVTGAVVDQCEYGIRVGNSVSDMLPATPIEVRANAITASTGGRYGIYASGNDRSDLSIVGNLLFGPTSHGAIYVSASSDMPHARIDSNTVDGARGTGIYVRSADTIRIRENTVTNLAAGSSPAGGAAALVLGNADVTDAIAEVRGNRITAGTGSGIRLYRTLSTDTVTVLVDSNVVQGVDSMGVWVSYYSRARITRNAIDAVGLDAVYLNRSNNDSTAFAVNNNNFTNSGRYGVYNLDGVTADASNNWWNHAAGPSGFYGEGTGASTGDSVSSNVGWSPHLTAPEGSAPTPAPPLVLASLQARAMSVSATPADATAAASVVRGANEDELVARQEDAEERRAAKEARRTERAERRNAAHAQYDAERLRLRQDAERRRAEALARGGRP